MSLQHCQPNDTLGFPMRLNSALSNLTSEQQTSLTEPTDFTVNWAPPAPLTVNLTQTPTRFNVDLTTFASGTTLTYGSATYTCSSQLSIVNNQHGYFYTGVERSGTAEAILAFQIKNADTNPSSPHIILICRPIVLGEQSGDPFLNAVNAKAVSPGDVKSVNFDISKLFAYNTSTLLPMITYQTCVSTKWAISNGNGSIRIRVHLVTQPIYAKSDTNGLGRCTSVNRYILTTPVENLFPGATFVQFKDGSTSGYPSGRSSNLALPPSGTSLLVTDAMAKLSILVPEQLLGKTLAEVADSSKPPPSSSKNKAFKCYRIDSTKDIDENNQILIDPSTGESLSETRKQETQDSTGGDPGLVNALNGKVPDPSGLMPGDIQFGIYISVLVFGTIGLLIYVWYVTHLFINLKQTQTGLYHLCIFILILVGLAVFGSLYNKKK